MVGQSPWDVPLAGLGCNVLHRWAGVCGYVAVFVHGLIQVQGLPTDLQCHATMVEGGNRGRGHRHIWSGWINIMSEAALGQGSLTHSSVLTFGSVHPFLE